VPPTKGSVAISNNHHGFVVELMLLARLGPGVKVKFIKGGKVAMPGEVGVLIPDWSSKLDGRWEHCDIKSDRVDLLNTTGDGTGAISEYAAKYARGLAPGGQLDPSSRVTIWFREVPPPTVRKAMMNEAARLLGEGLHQLRFGEESPQPIKKEPLP
jgi:hypothetical protein